MFFLFLGGRVVQDEYRKARGELPVDALAFTPVPRRNERPDGWLAAKQVAFIGYLADTGSVTRAARMVGMSQANCYTLRRAPGAESFRRAWDAALDFGVGRLKDIAFERAIEGELIPLFEKGKLFGYRRKFNNALLMFCLRHYGQDANGRRTTVNYFSTKASAGAAAAEASTTTVRTVITGDGGANGVGDGEAAARTLQGFEGVELDAEAHAAVEAAVAACIARRAEQDEIMEQNGFDADELLADDRSVPFVRAHGIAGRYLGPVEPAAERGAVWEPVEESGLLLAGPDESGAVAPASAPGTTKRRLPARKQPKG